MAVLSSVLWRSIEAFYHSVNNRSPKKQEAPAQQKQPMLA